MIYANPVGGLTSAQLVKSGDLRDLAGMPPEQTKISYIMLITGDRRDWLQVDQKRISLPTFGPVGARRDSSHIRALENQAELLVPGAGREILDLHQFHPALTCAAGKPEVAVQQG